jgi:hypothetical protein
VTKSVLVRSPQLQAAVGDFLTQAAAALQADVHAGHEVPFELASHSPRSRGSSPLYCYRPLTSPYIAERFPDLCRLGGYQQAVLQLERSDGLERYLTSLAAPDRSPRSTHRRADVALLALLREVFDEQSDFELRPERLQRALDRLDGPSFAEADEVTLVATLHGLTISSPELPLTHGLAIAHPGALSEAPDQALWVEPLDWGGQPARHGSAGSAGASHEHEHLLAVFRANSLDPRAAIAQGREVLRELLRALRLFGDGRIALGPLAHARVGNGSWSPLALGTGGHPHGMLLVGPHQEDELRAFCNLVSRRAPHSSEIAWALQRFELGCERPSEYEGLSDHILALRTLLAAPACAPAGSDPGVSPDGLLAGRLAALCATPDRRSSVASRTLAALVLERHAIAGTAVERASGLAVARELADHLRALLRDVICGHLPADLTSLADELLLSSAEMGEGEAEAEAVGQDADNALIGQQAAGGIQSPSGEQSLGEDRQPSEILHLAV